MEELDVLTKAGIDSERARASFYRCVNAGMAEFAAFEIARAEECERRLEHIRSLHPEDQDEERRELQYVQGVPNPFERRREPRDANPKEPSA